MLKIMIKLTSFSKLLLVPVLACMALFANNSSALADDAPKVVHETDSGSMVELTVGETVEFSLAENIPNTTSWIPYMPWSDTADSIEQIGSSIVDASQTPMVLNFFYSAKNPGQTILVFYKNGMTSGIPNSLIKYTLAFPVRVSK